MNIPVQPLLLSIPSLLYIIINRLRKQEWPSLLSNLGWQLPPVNYLVIGLGVGLLPGFLSLILPDILPVDILDQPGVAQSAYRGWNLSVWTFFLAFLREAIYTAIGEEILFRGFLGGILNRRLGFTVGNVIQAILFLLPHLLLLTISTQLWPMLILQFLSGWLFGWLCYKSESIIPSWLAHSLSNAFGAVMFMN